jgi:hypothetical protein
MTTVIPGDWMLTNMKRPSCEHHVPANSFSFNRFFAPWNSAPVGADTDDELLAVAVFAHVEASIRSDGDAVAVPTTQNKTRALRPRLRG